MYTTAKLLLTTNQVALIGKREFAKIVLDENSKTFVVHVVAPEAETSIYLLQAAQIAALQWDKASTKIPAEYSDYTNIFSLDLAMELPKNTSMKKHANKLTEGKQPLYGPIYILSLVELEILKTYIKTHLKPGFFQPSKSFTGASILFDKKLDGSLYLYVNYQSLNDFIIKNRYLCRWLEKT